MDMVGFALYEIFILVILIVTIVFWTWMFVDCLKRSFDNSTDKLVWVIVLLLFYTPGAILYYFLVYRKQKHHESRNTDET